MDIKTSLNKLYSLHAFGVKLGLENISNFLELLDNPQKKFKAIHIAGSNGKGSTASFIASILMELGYKTGLYTSPHFIRFNERVRINNTEIPDTFISKFLNEWFHHIEKNKITFFEATTAMAFAYFAESKLDFAVIETGLGGRLDATNVLSPICEVITSISYEHTEILGNTLEQIAYEKGEIIKINTKVFIGNLPPATESVIRKKCEQTGSELFKVEDYIKKNVNEKNNSVNLSFGNLHLNDKNVPLKGIYQKYNAALASLTINKTLDVNDFTSIEKGVKNVVKNTSIKGRFEFYKNNPDIIFDSSHNPESILNFINEFSKISGKYKNKSLLYGAMKDKAIEEILKIMKDKFDDVYITAIDMERACKLANLKTIASRVGINTKEVYEPAEFVKKFEKRDKNDCLVICGSMYLIGEIKSRILAEVT
jgi:dihydrofolate synthase / folylpolyglutamate synthase